MIRTGGQRFLIAWARCAPSIDPGMRMSVNTTRNVAACFQGDKRLIGIPGFKDFKAGIPDRVGGCRANQEFVFYNEH